MRSDLNAECSLMRAMGGATGKTRATRWLALAAVMMLVTTLAACRKGPPPVQDVALRLVPSHTSLVVGETVTVKAEAFNLTGEDTELRWETTGGSLKHLSKDRAVQVTFDKPGTYRIHGQLYMRGKLAESSYVDVTVRPVP